MSEATLTTARDSHQRLCQSVHEPYPLIALARGHHQNKRGEPMSFADKPYLLPLYATWLNNEGADVCKAPQTGITELLIQLMLYKAGWQGRICAYVLPQYKTGERFVSQRIDPVMIRVGAYAERMGGAQWGAGRTPGNLKVKRFGSEGSLLFLGSNTPADFLEFSADTIIVDEYDECNIANVGKARDRLRESRDPQLFRVSNPKSSGQGVTRLWREGSRGKWNHQCPRCNHRQPLDWFKHFVRQEKDGRWMPRDTERAMNPGLGDLRPVCAKCNRTWSRVHKGSRWVHERRQRRETIHISRLDVLSSTHEPQPIRGFFAEWIAAQGDIRLLALFYVGVLGWPHEAIGSRITQEMLEAARSGTEPTDWQGGEQYEDVPVVMGVDVGSVLNVKISVIEPHPTDPEKTVRRCIRTCTVAQFEDLYDLQALYFVDVMVIDALPETRKAKEVRDHYFDYGGCEVWLCQYFPTGKVGADAFGIRMNYEDQVVTVDRTQLLDTTMAELNTGQATLPSDSGTILGFDDQMKAPIRKLNERGDRMIWDEGSEADHFRHADAYERVAKELFDRGGSFQSI